MRFIRRVTSAVFVLAVALFGGAGWYYSGEIESGAFTVENRPASPDLLVTAVDGDAITLQGADGDDWVEPGTWGLSWSGGGYGRIGAILGRTEGTVTRAFVPVAGELRPGDRVAFDRDAYPSDPRTGLGIPYDDVAVAGEIGEFPAWLVPGDPARWAIVVHGKGRERTEALRILPVLREAGLTVLVVTYRNDPGVPPDPSGRYDYGVTAWRDIDAAAEYAVSAGATSLVMYGFSMGGGIVMSFMEQSAHADLVEAMVLDSPVLDFGTILDYQGERRNLPAPLTWLSKKVAGWRLDVDWERLNYLDQAAGLPACVLVFHSRADETIPYESSALLVADVGTAKLVTFDTAIHSSGWNAEPERYESQVRDFLAKRED